MRFHMRVAECTGCAELCQALVRNQVLVFNWLYDTALGNSPPSAGWHSQLAESLPTGNPDAADAAMRRHTRHRREDVLARIEPIFGWTEARMAAFPKGTRKTSADWPRIIGPANGRSRFGYRTKRAEAL